jgi:hypothetical protein
MSPKLKALLRAWREAAADRRGAPLLLRGLRSLQARRNTRTRATACLCVLLVGGIATAAARGGSSDRLASAAGATGATGATAAPPPTNLSQEALALASLTVSQWPSHELPRGALVDPVDGPLAGNYGVSMTGQAMVEAGAASSNEALIENGLDAELSEVSHPDGGSFELLSLSAAYSYNQAELAANSEWDAARPKIARFLRDRGQSISDLGVCFTSPHCYTNLKLVSAVADLSLLRTGLRSNRRHALLSAPSGLRSQALRFLAMAVSNTSDDAYRTGVPAFSGAGILSDPTENPLAYHALSTLMLGKAILLLGSRIPPGADAAFTHAAKALVALIAPDGDDTYIGRGQGQVWTVAATIDALATAAELTPDATWRGRYLTGVALELGRLEALYPSHGWGFPLVPRFAGGDPPSNYRGIDHYASTVEYNGLALWELQDAAAQLAYVQSAPNQPLPSESDGAFIDPSHAQFAAVTSGNLWFAVHAIDSNPGDARYGFGLVAAELDTTEGWQSVLPPRPLTTARMTGGLAMEAGGVTLYPAGTRIGVAGDGIVTVRGAWLTPSSKLRDSGTVWTFRPTTAGDGVALSFAARAGSGYAFQVWYEAGAKLARTSHGLSIVEPDGSTQTYSVNVPVRLTPGASASSAYAAHLRSTIITVPPTSRANLITYTTVLAGAGAATGQTGASGSTASSGLSGPSGQSGSSGASAQSGTSGTSGSSGL